MISCCTHSGVEGPSPWSGVNRYDTGTRYDITCTHSGVEGPSPWSGANRYDTGTRYDIMLHTQWGQGSKPLVRSQQVWYRHQV